MSVTITTPRNTEVAPAVREILVTVLASASIALLAQIAIPIGPVPITGSTLAVLGVSWTLGRTRALQAVVLYLAKGAAGLPVFAGGTSGIPVFLGPTGGYLLGYVLAALVVGSIADRARRRSSETSPVVAWGAFLAGTFAVYAAGLLVLSRLVPEGLLAVGLLPFLPGDLMKLFILVGLLPGLNALRGAR
jgi:biotin transport system substrate-specific component